MIESTVRERAVLDLLRDRYESRGDVFFAHPSPILVPPFLNGYRPDALVKSGGGGVVIEIKQSSSPRDHRLSEIAERFRDHPEWTFLIVQADELAGPPQRFATGSDASIADAIDEMKALAKGGHRRAAFLTGWSILEALARTKLEIVLKNRNQSFTATALAETLEQYGLVTPTEGRTLRALAPLRNSVVHGDFQASVGQESVEKLSAIVRRLKEAQALSGELNGAA